MDIQQPLISVIVPIYNVEKYVRKCLDSLVNQTMKQIEVICIDDGSIDNSGRIADEYAKDDERFKIIHTENRGLSAARNRGIEEARSQWLMFVDSDDWVDKEFCRIPYEAAMEYGADLVCFDFYRVTRLGRVKKPKKTNAPTGIVDEITAHEYGGMAAWRRLYRKCLFEGIRYPEGRVYEDVATTHKLVHMADQIVLLPDRLCFHVDRRGSISHTHTENNKRDGFVSALERYEYLTRYGYPAWKIEWFPQRYAIRYLASTQLSQDAMYAKACEIVNKIHGIPKEFSVKQKIGLIAWKIDKRLFYLVCKVNGRVNKP